jgi:hypothetical protein
MTADLRQLINGTYDTGYFPGELWSRAGATVTVVAPGGDVPAFTAQVPAPAVLTISAASVQGFATATRGHDIVVGWQGSGACQATFTFFARQGNTPTTYNATCSFPSADGDGTIPAGALMPFPAGLHATYTFDCMAINDIVAGDWEIRIRAYSAGRTAAGQRSTGGLSNW